MSRKGIGNLPTKAKRITITLEKHDIETLLRVGNGNASMGVRKIIADWFTKQKKLSK